MNKNKKKTSDKRKVIKMVKTEEVKYNEFGNCVRIYNEVAEIFVTLDLGPRIIKYNLLDKPNVFCEHMTQEPQMEETGWKIYGGHRLWHAPESIPRTYEPDNEMVNYIEIENGIQITSEIEKTSGLLKNLVVILAQDSAETAVIHSVANKGVWAKEYAVWALSVMAAGGVEVIPNNQNDTGLLHNRSLSLWPYAKMNDERVYWGDKYITLRQDVNAKTAFKMGITNKQAWAAYYNNNQAFVKRYAHYDGETYPDNNVSFETYTNDFMLEVETLSPMVSVNPGEMIEHIEVWNLTADVEAPQNTEQAIQDAVDKLNIPAPLIGGCGCDDDHDHDGCDCDGDCGDDCECNDDHGHDDCDCDGDCGDDCKCEGDDDHDGDGGCCC